MCKRWGGLSSVLTPIVAPIHLEILDSDLGFLVTCRRELVTPILNLIGTEARLDIELNVTTARASIYVCVVASTVVALAFFK